MTVLTGDQCALNLTESMSKYPLRILKACASLDELQLCKEPGFVDSFMPIMMRLIKKISLANPYQPIFARRDTLARESGKSVETVGRALKWLEDHNCIQREQTARPGLRGSTSNITFTQKLVSILGLDINEPSPCKNDGSVSAPQESSLKKQSDEILNQVIHKPAQQRNFTLIQGRKIPTELAWMIKDNGIAATALLMLMGLAKSAGKRLSDVVFVSREYLKECRGNALIAYVTTLIMQNKDYAYLARSSREKEIQDQQTKQQADLLERKIFEWQGQSFANKKRNRIYRVVGNYLEVSGDVAGIKRIDLDFVEAVMEQRLIRCTS